MQLKMHKTAPGIEIDDFIKNIDKVALYNHY